MHEDILVNIVPAKDLCLVRDLRVVVLSFHTQDFACRVHSDHLCGVHVCSVHLHNERILDRTVRSMAHLDIEYPARDPVALDLDNTLIDCRSSELNAVEKRISDANGVQPDSVSKDLLQNLVQEVAFVSHTETEDFGNTGN
jgi:hypothetical protein